MSDAFADDHRWVILSKRETLLYIGYGYTHTQLWAYNAQARVGSSVELQFDLNRELNKRNKQANIYTDARDLADGEIQRLKLVQLNDDYILGCLGNLLSRSSVQEQFWNLTLLLDLPRRFRVKPEVLESCHRLSLMLHRVG